MYRARHGRSMVATDNALFPYDAESLAEQVQQLRRVRNEQAETIKSLRAQLIRKQDELSRTQHRIVELEMEREGPNLFGPESSGGGAAAVHKQVARLQDALQRKDEEVNHWKEQAAETTALREQLAVFQAQLSRSPAGRTRGRVDRTGPSGPGSGAGSRSVISGGRSAVSAARPGSARSRRRVYQPEPGHASRTRLSRPRSAVASPSRHRRSPFAQTAAGVPLHAASFHPPRRPRSTHRGVGANGSRSGSRSRSPGPPSPVYDTYFDVVPDADAGLGGVASDEQRRTNELHGKYEELVERQRRLEAQLAAVSSSRQQSSMHQDGSVLVDEESGMTFEAGSRIEGTVPSAVRPSHPHINPDDPDVRVLEAVQRARQAAEIEEQTRKSRSPVRRAKSRRKRRTSRGRRARPTSPMPVPPNQGRGTKVTVLSDSRKRHTSPRLRKKKAREGRVEKLRQELAAAQAKELERNESARRKAEEASAAEARARRKRDRLKRRAAAAERRRRKLEQQQRQRRQRDYDSDEEAEMEQARAKEQEEQRRKAARRAARREQRAREREAMREREKARQEEQEREHQRQQEEEHAKRCEEALERERAAHRQRLRAQQREEHEKERQRVQKQRQKEQEQELEQELEHEREERRRRRQDRKARQQPDHKEGEASADQQEVFAMPPGQAPRQQSSLPPAQDDGQAPEPPSHSGFEYSSSDPVVRSSGASSTRKPHLVARSPPVPSSQPKQPRPDRLPTLHATGAVHVHRGGLFHVGMSGDSNAKDRLNWLSDLFDAAAYGGARLKEQDLVMYLERQARNHAEAVSEYNSAVETASEAGDALPARPISLQGSRLTFGLVCKFVHEGAIAMDTEWPDEMSLEEYLTLADAAFRFGSGPDTSPPLPDRVRRDEALPHSSDNGRVEVFAAPTPEGKLQSAPPGSGDNGAPGSGTDDTWGGEGTDGTGRHSSRRAASDRGLHRAKSWRIGDAPHPEVRRVLRGGLWHCAMCATDSTAARQDWLKEVWEAVAGITNHCSHADMVPFLERNAVRADTANDRELDPEHLTFSLICKFLFLGVEQNEDIEWPDHMEWSTFLPVAERAFCAGITVPTAEQIEARRHAANAAGKSAAQLASIATAPPQERRAGLSFAAAPERPKGKSSGVDVDGATTAELLRQLREGGAHGDGTDELGDVFDTATGVGGSVDGGDAMDVEDEMDADMEAEAAEVIQAAFRSFQSRRVHVSDRRLGSPPPSDSHQTPRRAKPQSSPPPADLSMSDGGATEASSIGERTDDEDAFMLPPSDAESGSVSVDDAQSRAASRASRASSASHKQTVIVVHSVSGVPDDCSSVGVAFSWLGHDVSCDAPVVDGHATLNLSNTVSVGVGTGERGILTQLLREVEDGDYEDDDAVFRLYVTDDDTGATIGAAGCPASLVQSILQNEQDAMEESLEVANMGEGTGVLLKISVFLSEAAQDLLYGGAEDDESIDDADSDGGSDIF